MVKCVLVKKGHCDEEGGVSLDSVLAFALRLAPMEVFGLSVSVKANDWNNVTF